MNKVLYIILLMAPLTDLFAGADVKITLVFNGPVEQFYFDELWKELPLLNEKYVNVETLRLKASLERPQEVSKGVELLPYFQNGVQCDYDECLKFEEFLNSKSQNIKCLITSERSSICNPAIGFQVTPEFNSINLALATLWDSKKGRKLNPEAVIFFQFDVQAEIPELFIQENTFEIIEGQSINLNVESSHSGGYFEWDFNNLIGSEITVSPTYPKTYKVKQVMKYCESELAEINVNVLPDPKKACPFLVRPDILWTKMDSIYKFDDFENANVLFPSNWDLDYFIIADTICGADEYKIRISSLETNEVLQEFAYTTALVEDPNHPNKFIFRIKSQYIEQGFGETNKKLRTQQRYRFTLVATDTDEFTNLGTKVSTPSIITFSPCEKY